MSHLVYLFWSLVISATPVFSKNPAICENLAKFTCEHKNSIQGEQNYNEYLERVQTRYLEFLDAELVKYPLTEFLNKTGLQKPEACVSEKMTDACREALKKDLVQTAGEIQKHFLGKESKYSDPNIPRSQLLFDLFDGNAHHVGQKVMDEHEDDLKHVEVNYKNVKEALIKKVSSQASDPLKTEMIKRIKGIEFNSKLCTSSYYTSDYALTVQASYESNPHAFTVCPKLILSSLNDTQMSVIIGHEITHSIDTCSLGLAVGKTGKKIYPPALSYNPKTKTDSPELLDKHPYGSVLKCLRQSKSAAAKTIPIEGPEWYFLSESKINPVLYQLCQRDQINESFADWLGIEAAVESLSEAQKNMSQTELEAEYAAVYSTKCNEVMAEKDPHPSLDRRANGILGVNPKVREILKCELPDKKDIYCAPPDSNLDKTTFGSSKKTKVKGQN